MRAKITKWGDVLALRLPRKPAEGGALKITRVRKTKKFELGDLLANEERASAVGWGKAKGNEAW